MSIPLHLYLPIAGNSVNLLVILCLGGAVGLLSGHLRGGRRVPDDAASNNVRHSSDCCGGFRFEPDRRGFDIGYPCAFPSRKRRLQNGHAAFGRRGRRGNGGSSDHQGPSAARQRRFPDQPHLCADARDHRELHVRREPPVHAQGQKRVPTDHQKEERIGVCAHIEKSALADGIPAFR